MPIKHIKGKDLFEDIKNSDKPVSIAKFSANWCKPCSIASEFIKSLDNDGKIDHAMIYEIDVEEDDSMDLATKLGIRSLPTFIKFSKDGEAIDQKFGASSPEELLNLCKI